jgi:hypothetical protein
MIVVIMQFETLERGVFWAAFVLSVLNTIFAILTLQMGREKFKPNLDISLNSFPPYEPAASKTIIHIANTGGRMALIDKIEILYSPVLSTPLLLKDLKNSSVRAGSSIDEVIVLPDPVKGKNVISVSVFYRYGWRGRRSGKSTLTQDIFYKG